MSYVLPNFIESTDATANISTSYDLGIGQTAQGLISTVGDHDWYRVSLVAGQTYAFAEIGTGTNSLQDTYLNLRNSSGTLICFDDDNGPRLSSSFTFTATTTGAYYLDAGAFNDTSTGQYGLTATLGTRPNFDIPMGGGAIDAYSSWSAAGTGATVTYGFRQSPATYTVAGATSRLSRSSPPPKRRRFNRSCSCGPMSPTLRSCQSIPVDTPTTRPF
jgi:serralysin